MMLHDNFSCLIIHIQCVNLKYTSPFTCLLLSTNSYKIFKVTVEERKFSNNFLKNVT